MRLILPVDGPAIVYDGHDFYSHHRRIPLGSAAEVKERSEAAKRPPAPTRIPSIIVALVIIAVAVIMLITLKRKLYGEAVHMDDATGAVKAVAVFSIVLWVPAIATGRWMAYVT